MKAGVCLGGPMHGTLMAGERPTLYVVRAPDLSLRGISDEAKLEDWTKGEYHWQQLAIASLETVDVWEWQGWNK